MIAFFSSFRRPHAIALAILVAGVTPLLMNGAESGISVGTVSDPAIKEASGLVASVDHPGVLWTHNDSNASLFALRTNGELIARFKIPGAAGGNFEDLAFAPGTQPGSGHLYLGDIGDNKRERDSIAVFRTPEPPLGANKKAGGKLSESKKIILRYPDGPYDAESLFIDPLSGDLFIATKEKRKARVYTASKAQLEGNAPVLLRFVCELRIASASGAAISADGTQIALRNEDSAQLWIRKTGSSVADALREAPSRLPLMGRPKEPNGEAIAFDPSGNGYYTLSEGQNPTIYFFKKP